MNNVTIPMTYDKDRIIFENDYKVYSNKKSFMLVAIFRKYSFIEKFEIGLMYFLKNKKKLF